MKHQYMRIALESWDKWPWNLDPWWARRELQHVDMNLFRGPKAETASSICSTAKCQCQSIVDVDLVWIGLQRTGGSTELSYGIATNLGSAKKQSSFVLIHIWKTWTSICSSPFNDTQTRKNHRYIVQIHFPFKVHWLGRFGSGKSFSMCSL